MGQTVISRRYLLLAAGVAFPALFVPRCRAIFKHLAFRPGGDEVAIKPIPANPFKEGDKSLVAVVKGGDPLAMVKKALELMGGLERLAIKDKEVLLKPNVVASSPPPTTTSPELIEAVVRFLYSAGAKKVKVADMSAIITLPTKRNMERTGIKKAAERAGAEVIYLDDRDWVKVSPPQARYAKSFYISREVYEAQSWITMPVIKTHHAATYSISLKNFIGVVHPRNRPSIFRPKEWEEIIAEMNLPVHPDLVIADGTKSMVAGGPWSGTEAATGLIIVSSDRVAADLAGLALIKSFRLWPRVADPPLWQQRQIKRAIELGLGAKGPEEVKLVSASLDREDEDFFKLMEKIETSIKAEGQDD